MSSKQEIGRWEIVILLFITVAVATGIFIWLNVRELPAEQPSRLIQINPLSRLAASGSPLPAPVLSDVVVEQQQFDGRIFRLQYDIDNHGNWQLDFALQAQPHRLRYLASNDQFFYFNFAQGLWDEVDPALLHEDLQHLADIEQYLLSPQQLDAFIALATEQPSKECQQDDIALCAVWMAEDLVQKQNIFIYVSKRTRNIDQIVIVNPDDVQDPPLIANYFYQPVTVTAPETDKTRYLP